MEGLDINVANSYLTFFKFYHGLGTQRRRACRPWMNLSIVNVTPSQAENAVKTLTSISDQFQACLLIRI